jgi:DNA-binding transcriptional ArsR family regulator
MPGASKQGDGRPSLGATACDAEGGDGAFELTRSWGFITSHARVLLAVAQEPELRVGAIAEAADVTERSVYRILADLVEAGYLRRRRAGTHNLYELHPERPLGDPVVEEQAMGELLSLINVYSGSGALQRSQARGPHNHVSSTILGIF